jgi:hypothetical protein
MFRWGTFKEFLIWNLFIVFLFHSLKGEASAFDCPTLFEKAVAHMRRVREDRKLRKDILEAFVEETLDTIPNNKSYHKLNHIWEHIKPSYRLAKNTTKTVFYPYIFALRIPQALITTPILTLAKRNPHYLYLYPLELARRDGVKMTGYFALTALGINIFEYVIENHEPENEITFIDELLKISPLDALKENERAILLSGNDKNIEKYILDFIAKEYPALKDKIEVISSTNNDEVIGEIQKLQGKSNVKYLIFAAHGSSGSMNFNAKSIADLSFGLRFKASSIPDIKTVGHNVFTKDSKLIFFSCNVAEGSDGKDFIKQCSKFFDPPPTKSIASTLILYAGHKKEYMDSFRKFKNSMERGKRESILTYATVYGVYYPAAGAYIYKLFGVANSSKEKVFIYDSSQTQKLEGEQSKVP